MSRYNKYIYLEPKAKAPIMVYAKKKPSFKNIPRSGAWVVREWHTPSLTVDGFEGGWVMLCFPEITWHYLKTFTFIGKVKDNEL